MVRRRLIWRLYPTYLLMTLLALLAIVWYTSSALSNFYRTQRTGDLEAVARLLTRNPDLQRLLEGTPQPGAADELCREVRGDTGFRTTLVLANGTVLGDSDQPASRLDDHADRPEIRTALAGTRGSEERYSDTLRTWMLYVAIPVHRGDKVAAVVRVSMPTHELEEVVSAMRERILFSAAAIAAVGALGSFLAVRHIIRPLEDLQAGAERFAAGDLATRLPVPDGEELGRLAESMNRMAAHLDERIRTVTRQRNEQEAILSSMIEGVLAVDTEQRIISINRSAARILGLPNASVHGRSLQEVVRNGQLQEFVARALEGPGPEEGEIVLRDVAGERFLQVHGAILADAAKHAIGAVIVLNDISRLRRLERIRSEFVANVSHELRTPITSIKGFVETLLDGAIADPHDAERFLSVIDQQVERLNAIIEDLLMLSRVEQENDVTIVIQQVLLRSVLNDAVQVCQFKAEEKGIEIQVDCPADLSGRMNAALVEQAVVNLIDNALKYSEPGMPVQVMARPEAGGVVIQVVDRGCGIGREHLPRLFERFYRVDKARSRKLGGTGLGLSIVKHIVQAHGGQVNVESAPGKGSVFTISLPPKDSTPSEVPVASA